MMTLAALCVLSLVFVVRRVDVRRLRRPQAAHSDDDLVLLGDIVVLGLLSGMPFVGALGAAAAHVGPVLAADVRTVVSRASLEGSSAAFAAWTGPAAPLTTLAARAATTGAPMLAAVAAFTRERRNRQRTAAISDARRLGVRLIFPLALLILPGFVLLVAGPIVVEGLARFDL